ncbi:hypothetical protein ACLB2K_069085 [Fragaria x ananassa]
MPTCFRISTIPTWIGDLISLIEVDLSSNLLSDLPKTFSNLHNLKLEHLPGLKTIVLTHLLLCLSVIMGRNVPNAPSLDLHNTEITIDILRQIEGWENFDKLRRLKQQKKLVFSRCRLYCI